MEIEEFTNLISRVRAGDDGAASELVAKYERAVRIAVRVRLTDPRMRRQFDSMDVCQSVMGSFFLRAAAGQFDISEPRQLVALLTQMAQNKLLMQVRRHKQAKRDVRRVEPLSAESNVSDKNASPDWIVARRELLAELFQRLSDKERELARHRIAGRTWSEIAGELGESPQALRMRFSRALDRVSAELGIEDLVYE